MSEREDTTHYMIHRVGVGYYIKVPINKRFIKSVTVYRVMSGKERRYAKLCFKNLPTIIEAIESVSIWVKDGAQDNITIARIGVW